mgnify:CR=1 FL=1
MQTLVIGGTGNISSYVVKRLLKGGKKLCLLNRGNGNASLLSELKNEGLCTENIEFINESINNEENIKRLIKNREFSCVMQFIAYETSDIERDIRLFSGKTRQYIFISSASCYQKPCLTPFISEETPLSNIYWEYSRKKIACEERLIRENNFPITIVRPSHTYGEKKLPLAIHGNKGSWQTIKRIIENKPVIIPGDGLSSWVLTHSEDFAKGFCPLVDNKRAIGENYHITSDEAVSWLYVYAHIASLLSRELKPCFVPSSLLSKSRDYDFKGALLGDKSNSVIFDNSKIKAIAKDFNCDIKMKDGIEKSLKYLLSHKELQTEDMAFDEFSDKICALMNELEYKIKSI